MSIAYPVAMFKVAVHGSDARHEVFGQFPSVGANSVSVESYIQASLMSDYGRDLGLHVEWQDRTVDQMLVIAELRVLGWTLYGVCRGIVRSWDSSENPQRFPERGTLRGELNQFFTDTKYAIVNCDSSMMEVLKEWDWPLIETAFVPEVLSGE